MLVSDMIIGRANAWLATYDPSRKALRETPEFIKEQANVAAQYADWVTGGDVTDVDGIPPGEGALIRQGMEKMGRVS